jgi:MoaA/NifB/PqqE/SkfB family radical SAM enzyme
VEKKMAAMFAWPSQLKVESSGLALTFVLPAESCDLSCSFCAIKQRKETNKQTNNLSVEDYVYFLEDVVQNQDTAIMAIQGYEPLLPESWPYTQAILETGRRLGIPTSLITNGTLLSEKYKELSELQPTGVTISIDSDIAAEHDKLRGKVGAFETSIAGIKLLASVPGFSDRITLSSVLMPRRRHLLEGMPKLLNSLGLRYWVVAPLFRMNKADIGGPVGTPSQIVEDLLILSKIASDYDVSLVLDDELKILPKDEFAYTDLLVRRFNRPDGLIRLVPSGACSSGEDILRHVDDSTPVWHPGEIAPYQFLKTIVPNDLTSFKMAA